MREYLSWACYIGAGVSLAMTIYVAVRGWSARDVLWGNLCVATGVSIMLSMLGHALADNYRSLPDTIITLGVGLIGYVIFFFGRRRARDETRFFNSVHAASEQQKRNLAHRVSDQ